MATRIARDTYKIDTEEEFLTDAITDLNRGETTYVYKQNILDRLKGIFNELDIKKNEFYWAVRNMEVERQKPKKGRPKKIEVSK